MLPKYMVNAYINICMYVSFIFFKTEDDIKMFQWLNLLHRFIGIFSLTFHEFFHNSTISMCYYCN